MKKNVFYLAVFFALQFMSSCSNNKNQTTENDATGTELYGEEMRASSDIRIPPDWDSASWRYHSKSVQADKLVNAIMEAFLSGKKKAYMDFLDDKSILSVEEFKSHFNQIDTVMIDDPDSPGNLIMKVVANEFTNKNVDHVRMIEDWYFNEKTFTMTKKVKWICPVVKVYEADGFSFKGYNPLFYMKMGDEN